MGFNTLGMNPEFHKLYEAEQTKYPLWDYAAKYDSFLSKEKRTNKKKTLKQKQQNNINNRGIKIEYADLSQAKKNYLSYSDIVSDETISVQAMIQRAFKKIKRVQALKDIDVQIFEEKTQELRDTLCAMYVNATAICICKGTKVQGVLKDMYAVIKQHGINRQFNPANPFTYRFLRNASKKDLSGDHLKEILAYFYLFPTFLYFPAQAVLRISADMRLQMLTKIAENRLFERGEDGFLYCKLPYKSETCLLAERNIDGIQKILYREAYRGTGKVDEVLIYDKKREKITAEIRGNSIQFKKENARTEFADEVGGGGNITINSILSDTNRTEKIGFQNILVYTNIFSCTEKRHLLSNVNGELPVVNREGVRRILVPLTYCKTCQAYFMPAETYRLIRKEGQILCNVFEDRVFYNQRNVHNTARQGDMFSEWNLESLLKKCGYTVNQQDDLPDKARERILASIVDNEVMDTSRIASYLESFIALRKDQERFYNAVEKWKSDLKFISRYTKKSVPVFLIKSLQIKTRV